MIKFITLLFTFSVLNGQSILYSLPKETTHFEYSLNTHLKNAQETIIATPSMNTRSFKSKLIKAVSHGCSLTLITQNISNDPIALVAYQNIELLLYFEKPLKESTIIVDSNFMCTKKGSLGESKTTIICTDDSLLLQKTLKNIHQMRTHSKRYLE
ncbi:MAG: hypothetical protein NTY39_06355 [Campylobacterales bacterium]|nr:hypothetical protein [Campylobacterales bacterium]